MKTQERLLSLIKTVTGLFVLTVVFVFVFQAVQFIFIVQDQKVTKTKILNDILENKSQIISRYITDYTIWDEMVQFIETPAYKWARENVDASLTDDINAVWAYNRAFGLIYSVNNIDSDLLEEIPADKTLLKKLAAEKKIIRFYTKTKDGVFEIQGASVHRTNDTGRKSNPYGYVFSGRLLGQSYLSYISQIMGGELSLSTEENPWFAQKLGKLRNLFLISKELEGLKGETIAVLDAKVLSPQLKSVLSGLMFFAVGFIIFLTIFFFQVSSNANKWLIKPLKNILISLRRRSIDPIQFLQNEDSEFGEISKLIIQHCTRPSEELTEQERSHRQLRENEERLKFFAEHFPGFIVKDRDLKIIQVSDYFASSFDASKDKFLGKTDSDLWPEEIAKRTTQNDLTAFNLPKGEHNQIEEELEFEGKKRTFLTYRFVIPRPDGERSLGMLAVDITDRKKLEESSSALANVAEKISVPIIITDKDGKIEFVNEAFAKNTGYSLDEVKGKSPKVLKSGETLEDEYEAMWEAISNGNEWKGVLHNKKKNGEFYWSLISISPVKDDKGDIKKYIAVEQDVTESRKAQDEIKKAKDNAEVSSKAKNEFVGQLSHEIRTPLNSLVGVTDLLLETKLTTEQKEYVSIFKRAGDTLLTIVNDILDITKIESGAVQLDYVDFDIKDVVEKSIDVYQIRSQKKGVELKYLIAPDMVRSVVGDQNRLRQILVNLLGNAMKFTEQGEISVEVKNYKLQERDALIQFCVSDTGVGIPKDKLSSVFDSFALTDSSTARKYGGSGLGLAIAKRLVELMGGTIWVESVYGQGSKFFFTARFKYPDESMKSPVKPKNLKGVKILIADEDDLNRTKIRKMLESGGAIVGESEDLQSTFVELAKGVSSSVPYSVVIADSKLKEGGGFSFVETIRGNETFADLKIIIMLTERSQETLNRVRSMDIKHVFKPVKAQPLILSVENSLGIASSEEEEKKTTSSSIEYKKQLKILLCDDSEDTRILVKKFLAGTLHILDIAENGTVASNKFMEIDYDLVLLDMHMPVMDGFNAVKNMRKYEEETTKSHVPIIALTADAFKEDTARVIDAGCDGHVVKPLRKATLFEIIDKYSRQAS
ncbi:MAG: ATP-binding protein [Elusimicrobia bacterium]|nr:ATP-binding protein [Elusimicrobiota bacterium]